MFLTQRAKQKDLNAVDIDGAIGGDDAIGTFKINDSAGDGDIDIEGNIVYRAGGTDVPVADGGTGQSSFTANRILIGNGTSALAQVAIGNSGEFLISNGSGSAPSFTDTIDGGQYS